MVIVVADKTFDSNNITSFSVSYILREIKVLRFAQNDIFCHPERSEGSSWVISEKLVTI
jgi:hypothetical protein